MTRNTLLVCLITVFVLLSKGANADYTPPDNEILKQYQRAALRTIDEVLLNIRPVLTQDERRMLDQIDFKVNRNDWNVYGVFARRQGDERTIEFSMGFVIAVDYIDSAVVATEMLGTDKTLLFSYVDRVTTAVRETTNALRVGGDPVEIPTFSSWIGVSDHQWNELVNSMEFQNYRAIVKLHTFALIVGHEFAHHYEGHLENNTSSLEEEIEADVRGTEIAIAADYNTLLSWTPFLFFAALEYDQGIYDGSATHPPPVCRIIFILEEGIDDALDDEDFVDYLNQTGNFDAWFDNVIALEDVATSGELRCP